MLLNSNRNNEYVKRADGGFARGQATEDFWQKPAGSSSSHLAAGTDSLGNNARVVPPPLQQQPSLENATRWPVDAVLA